MGTAILQAEFVLKRPQNHSYLKTNLTKKMKYALALCFVALMAFCAMESDAGNCQHKEDWECHSDSECHNACGNMHCCEWDVYEGHKVCKYRGEANMCGLNFGN